MRLGIFACSGIYVHPDSWNNTEPSLTVGVLSRAGLYPLNWILVISTEYGYTSLRVLEGRSINWLNVAAGHLLIVALLNDV